MTDTASFAMSYRITCCRSVPGRCARHLLQVALSAWPSALNAACLLSGKGGAGVSKECSALLPTAWHPLPATAPSGPCIYLGGGGARAPPFAMEQPVSLDAEDIRNEKVKVCKGFCSTGGAMQLHYIAGDGPASLCLRFNAAPAASKFSLPTHCAHLLWGHQASQQATHPPAHPPSQPSTSPNPTQTLPKGAALHEGGGLGGRGGGPVPRQGQPPGLPG